MIMNVIALTEHQIQRQIIDECELRRILCWRNNSGAVAYEYKGKKSFVRFGGIEGASDLMGSYQGRFWVCEVKTKAEHDYINRNMYQIRAGIIKNKSKDIRYKKQINFIDMMVKEGHLGFFCSNVNDFMRQLRNGTLIGTKIDTQEGIV